MEPVDEVEAPPTSRLQVDDPDREVHPTESRPLEPVDEVEAPPTASLPGDDQDQEVLPTEVVHWNQ